MPELSPIHSASPVYGESVYATGPRNPERTGTSDTMESAKGPTAPAAVKWTPPSCVARYCTYVKHRIADFFDWVCSLFCSSKIATKQQVKEFAEKFQALINKIDIKSAMEKRYEGVKVSTPTEACYYLAECIECIELTMRMMKIVFRWGAVLDKNQKFKSEVALTERQMRSDGRQLTEIAMSVGTYAHSELSKIPTSAKTEQAVPKKMIEKIEAYSLGKLAISINGKVVSLIDECRKLPAALEEQASKVIEGFRKPILDKFAEPLAVLKQKVNECYKTVKLSNLDNETHAVHLLAHWIDVMELFGPLCANKGDISEESMTKRMEMLKECLARPLFDTATPAMRKKVQEHNFEKNDPCNTIYMQTYNREMRARLNEVRARLNEVVDGVQKPQEAPEQGEG